MHCSPSSTHSSFLQLPLEISKGQEEMGHPNVFTQLKKQKGEEKVFLLIKCRAREQKVILK